MKYIIEETITREYLIDAEDLEHALSIAHDVINDSTAYEESSHGITYIREIETGKDIII